MERARYISSGIIIGCFLLTLGLIGSFVKSYSATAGGNDEVLGNRVIAVPDYSDATLKATAQEINDTRSERGLPELAQSTELDAVARARADDMAKHSYYAHEGSDGRFFSDLMKEQGIGYQFACENLNIYYLPDTTHFVESWMDSPDHRDCLLKAETKSYGYAITKVDSLDGIDIDQHIIVAVYSN